MRYVILLALFATLVRADDDPEIRFLRAWYAMGEPDKAAAAAETFRRLYETEGTPRDLKARCLLGLAECAERAGDPAKARELLEKIVAEHAGTDAVLRARRLLGGTGYLDILRVMPKGSYLDLDDGSVSKKRKPLPLKEAEMCGDEFLVEAAQDADFATKVQPCSSKPWQRVRTSEGRTSWVQVLDAGCVRIVTRSSGLGEILPAPRSPFCLAVPKGIEISFEASRLFVRYRIERCAVGQEPVVIGTVEAPPFLDATAEEGVRYLYRVSGEDAGGVRGLPATLEGTRKSCGVVSGIAEMNRQDLARFDFLLGTVAEEGDVTMTGAFGNWDGATFTDAFGRELRALVPALGPRPAWDEDAGRTVQIQNGSMFVVPLRGGGVARCRLEMVKPANGGSLEAILHYEACGDVATLPMPVHLEATPDGDGAIVKVAVDPPYRVDRVEAFDLVGGTALAPLEVKDGVARDPSAAEGQIREYRAVAVDPRGRRSAAATVSLRRLPDAPRSGEFRFHYQQGYSLETGQIVPADQADVVFSSCAGGISSITLAAPGGIVNLSGILPRDLDPGTPTAIFGLVLRADSQLPLRKDADGDDRDPASDVFLLKTRHGGWAKLAITHRGDEGGWTEHLATVQYVVNFKEPVFAQGEGEAIKGISFGNLQPLKARAQIIAQWQKGWRQIVQNPEQRRGFEGEEAREEGTMPDPATTQEVLLSRQRYQDYEKATFSFVFGIRDDPGLKQTRNDWCLQYGNGGDTLSVRMVTDDRSTIADLGRDDWKGIAGRKQLREGSDDSMPTRYGHIYLVHTFDTDENFFALLRVTALRPGDMVAFEWVSLRGDRLGRSPGLALDAPTEAALQALLAALPKEPDARWSETEKAVRERLARPEFRIGVVDADAAGILRDLGQITDVRFAVKAKAPPTVSLFSARMKPLGVLDAICEQTGLRWRVEEDGSVTLE